ncbi:MAG TPA: response regulator [Alphaproteobacteria bacterium]|nr:response regulator [Alphaproteobacteria bacterium]
MKATLRILNLEDNARDAELTEAMVSARWPQSHFIRVDTRQEFISALDEDIDLILSDYTMPGFSGREALLLAHEKRPEIPFLFVSGTIGEDAAVEALKSGATDYVLKHRLMRLIPAIDRALREVEEHTERERAEEAMRQSEHKYRELFECLSDAAFLTDEKTGKIIDTNRKAETLLGLSRGEILGHRQSDFLSFNTTAHAMRLPDTKGLEELECDLVRANNGELRVDARATRLSLYGRSLVLWLCHEVPNEVNKLV